MTTQPHVVDFKLFQDIKLPGVEALLSKSPRLHLKAGESLLLPGEPLTHLYLIQSGWLKIYRLNEHGEEVITCLFGKGDTALADLILHQHRSPVGLQAETETDVIKVSMEDLRKLSQTEPQLNLNIMRLMSDMSQGLMYLVEQVTVQPAVERIAGFLLKVMLDAGKKPFTDFELPIEKAEIARHLGITPETFSRSIKELAKRGVTITGNKVHLATQKSLCANCDPLLAHECENSLIPGYCRMFKT